MAVILLLALVWLLAYFRVKLWISTIVVAAFLGYLAVAGRGNAVSWLIFVLAAILNVVPLRRVLLSRPLFGLFRKLLPPMSQTEREALEAGTVWWDGELFSGRPNWQKLLAEPTTALTPGGGSPLLCPDRSRGGKRRRVNSRYWHRLPWYV